MHIFLMYFLCKEGDLQLMLLLSVHVSKSSVMTWWWLEVSAETGCHINNFVFEWVGGDCEYL